MKIWTECSKAKYKWIGDQCTKREALEKKSIQQNQKNIKETCPHCSENKDGEVAVTEEQDILNRWAEYTGDLFDGIGEMLDFDEEKELSGNAILDSEVEVALKEIWSRKSPGNKNIIAELLTACKELTIENMRILASKIYRKGATPKQMKESVFIPLPKQLIYLSAVITVYQPHEPCHMILHKSYFATSEKHTSAWD